MPASPRAPPPTSPIGRGPGPAVPPNPVVGEPTGTIGVVVVVLPATVVVVTGTVVVVVAGTVVVVTGTVVVVTGTDVVVVVVTNAHAEAVMALSLSVTAPVLARTRPLTEAPLFNVAELEARMLPMKLVVEPRVADDPTCQNTLHACAPFSRTTLLADAVVSVLPAWKTKTAFESPPPFNVSVPVSWRLEPEL